MGREGAAAMNLRQLTRSDVAIGAAVVLLIWAAVAPRLSARSFHSLSERASTDVEALRAAALGTVSSTGAWPTAAEAGTAPPELSGAYPGEASLTFDGYTLQWIGLAVTDYEEAPPVTYVAPDPDEEGDEGSRLIIAPGDAPPDSVGPEMRAVARRIGAVVLYTSNDELLADLLTRYGSTVSYVRDSVWTLVVDDRETSGQR